ncbi:hypothetical protein MY1884_005721 [Beauveria asiatica]
MAGLTAEDANQLLSSHCDHHEANDRAELPQQSRSHESASHNISGSCDGDCHPSDEGDCDGPNGVDSESSSDSDGGSDGDAENDYNDDGNSSDADGKDSGRSEKRGTARSPSVTSSDNGRVNDPTDDNAEESPARPHKRQKIVHDEEDTALVRRQGSVPRSGGRLSRLSGRAQPASMLSPPASHNPSESESDKVSDRGEAQAASFGE